MFVHGPLFPLVLLTGFFTAGIKARYSINTFPHVGEHWILKKEHFQSDIPFWKNFTENKLVVQYTHRTLASLLAVISILGLVKVRRLRFMPR